MANKFVEFLKKALGFLKNTIINTHFFEKFFVPILTLIVAICAVVISYDIARSDNRIKKGAQVSDLQVTPVSFEIHQLKNNETLGTLKFKVINYSGFDATSIKMDANFAGVWIHEWVVNAAKGLYFKKKREGGLSEDLEYQLQQYQEEANNPNTFSLESGSTKDLEATGSFHPVKDATNNYHDINIKLSWYNENGAFFEKIYSFKIIDTEAYGVTSYFATAK